MLFSGENSEIVALDDVWHKLVWTLQRQSAQLWKGQLKDLSTIEISILEIIEKTPDVVLKEILLRLGVPNSTLTNALNRLERRGLIRRAINSKDKRSFTLQLTEAGLDAQQEHKRDEQLLWQRILTAFESTEERAEMIRLLGKLADSLSNTKED